MLAKDFQILENKMLYSFIGCLQQNKEPDYIALRDYYEKAKEHFEQQFASSSYNKHIFAIFLNNMLANAKYTYMADMPLIDRYLATFRSINIEITETETNAIKNGVYYYSVAKKDDVNKQEVIEDMLSVYGSLLSENSSALVLYWYEQVLLSAFAKLPFYRPDIALDITERSESTILEHNQIKSKLKSVGEVLWQ